MKRNWFAKLAAALACFGLTLPSAGLAAPPVASDHDVALGTGGLLVGQVLTQQGVAKAKANVSVRYGRHEVVRTTTDENGVFAAKGLRGGQYEILTDDAVRVCRLWAPNTAPPAARSALLLISGGDVVRGQGFIPGGQGVIAGGHGFIAGGKNMASGWVGWMKAHPFITAGTVAVAVATPLAFLDDDDENGS
jgi:hypothetical protein